MSELSNIIEQQINDYTEKYATKHHCTIEEAKKHIIVKIVGEYYRKNGGRND